MVSQRSELFAAHPDWAIGVPGRPRTEGRQQLVLDLSPPGGRRPPLRRSCPTCSAARPISYVKWDMNRNITEPYSAALPADRQGEFFHRYILGVYDLYGRLNAAFPEILFESCASGGGRFDPGLLAFAPQAWTSDDTDAVERLRIQWGTSLVYPLSSMGAHVSAVPNHQVGADHAARDAGRRRVLRRVRLRARLDGADRGGAAARSPTRSRSTRSTASCSSAAGSSGCVSPFEGDGNETAWMCVVAGPPPRGRRLLPRAQPAVSRAPPPAPARPRPGARRTGSRSGRRRDDAIEHANALRPRRRRPHGRRAVPRTRNAGRPRTRATSGPACSSWRRPVRPDRVRSGSRRPLTSGVP